MILHTIALPARMSDQKLTKPFLAAPAGITRSTLKRTVFDSGLQ